MSARIRFRQLLDEAPEEAPAIQIDGTWATWGSLRSIAEQLEAALRQRGLGPGARIGVVLENRPEHVAIVVALLATDRCVVTLSPLQPPARLAADVAAADLPALVASADVLATPGVEDAIGRGVALSLSGTSLTADRTDRLSVAEDRVLAPGVVVEMLTSGTTGPPKRVRITDKQFDAALSTSVPEPPVGQLFRSGVTLVSTPLVHIGGFWGALGPIYAGRRIVLMPRFSLGPWLEAVRAQRPRAVALVPAGLRAVLDAGVSATDLDSVEVITTGTAPCPVELIDSFLDRYDIRVLPTYGATEFAGAVATWSLTMHKQWWTRKKGSAGQALPGTRLRVVDEHGREVPPGEEGRLEVRSSQSAEGVHAWVRTSDLACIDEDQFLWIRGRADDAIVRGGFKIQPERVRQVLESHPAVREAAVAPLPDERLGQVPVAAVELRSHVDPIELREYCRGHLLPYEMPLRVVVLDALPRTPSSKVSRVDLLELIAAAPERQPPA